MNQPSDNARIQHSLYFAVLPQSTRGKRNLMLSALFGAGQPDALPQSPQIKKPKSLFYKEKSLDKKSQK